MDKIENIQKKPDYIKKRILFVVVAIIMFVIISVWVSTSNITAPDMPDGSRGGRAARAGDNRESGGNPASPFAVIRDIAKGGLKLVK